MKFITMIHDSETINMYFPTLQEAQAFRDGYMEERLGHCTVVIVQVIEDMDREGNVILC